MTQDPSDRAPSDPTAAPPDSASTPPQSWSAPDAASSDATPSDSTRDSPSDATSADSASDPAPGSAGESTQVIDTSAARPYAGYDPGRFADSPVTGQAAPGPGYSAPPAGNHRAPGAGEQGSSYGTPPPGAPGYGPPGYAAPSYGQQAEAAAYGNIGGQPGPPGPGPGPGYPPPGYAPGGYGYPGYPGSYGVPPPTNTMAILSLIFAFILPPVGIVLGFIARRQIRETGEQGDGIALAGLIISIAFTALFVLLLVIPILFVIFAAGAGGLS